MEALAHEIDQRTELDRVAPLLERLRAAMPADLREELGGRRLGHPLHPALTDLPVGFWTSAWVLDLVGGRRMASAATTLVGLGVASAVPTAAAGLVDWGRLSQEKRRTGVVHMVCNASATVAYTASFLARLRGRRGRGVLLGMVGAGLATAGGFLGGHLAFGDAPEEDRAETGGVPSPATATSWAGSTVAAGSADPPSVTLAWKPPTAQGGQP